MATHAVPRKNTYMGNICAFCKYFEADPQLKHHSIGFVAYDNKVKGRCLAIGYPVRPLSVQRAVDSS